MEEIYLTESDDFITAQNKIKDSAAGVITVVIPAQSLLGTPVNLRLLLREMSKKGVELKLRSDDPAVQKIIESMPEPALNKNQAVTGPRTAFVIGQDIAESQAQIPVQSVEAEARVLEKPSRFNKIPLLAKLSQSVHSFNKKTGRVVGFGKVLSFSVAFLGLLLALGVLYFLFVHAHRAKINLVVKPEGVIKSFEVSASPTVEGVDPANRKIPAVVHEFVEPGSGATKTTGTDIVGEKAVGKVTIYNKTDELKEFPKGTKLILVRKEGEELLYYLDAAARVEKREATTTESSAGEFSVKYLSGRVDVDVTAAQIGDVYNMNAGETYAVDNLPVASFIAENAGPIKGGSRREAVVVTQADQDRVMADLTVSLTNKLKERIPKELPEGAVVAPDAMSFSVTSSSFDKPVGTIADEVNGTVEVKALAFSYKQEDLEKLLSDALGGFVPERFTLSTEGKEVTIEGVKVQNGELLFFAKVSGVAVPKLDVDKIKADIRGKKIDMVQAYLSSLTVVESYTIELFPRLPGMLQIIPDNLNQIEVVTTHDQSK